jgi:RNA polymerase sigma-70 factor, ECF subfamily
MYPCLTEKDLLDAIVNRQDDALVAFDQAFRPQLMSFARRRGVSREDAEDAVQETLASAIRQIQEGKFEGRASLLSWMLGIMVRRCVDIRRGHFRQVQLVADSLDGNVIDGIASTSVTAGPSPETRLHVRELLLALPSRERQVLLLNKHAGLPAREIAPRLRLGVKVIESVLTRAKKRFCDLASS